MFSSMSQNALAFIALSSIRVFMARVFMITKVVNDVKERQENCYCSILAYRQLGELALICDEASLALLSDILVHLVHGVPDFVDARVVSHFC